ncbi:MAG: hypothetical protein ABI217_04695 [Chthoniobacterales bacterium]
MNANAITTNFGAFPRVLKRAFVAGLLQAVVLILSNPLAIRNASIPAWRASIGSSAPINQIQITTNPQKAIVRAIGPSLGNANLPVPGALADPTLELHNADGSVLASNHNWRDTQEAEIRHSLGRSVQHQPVIAVRRLAYGGD